MKNILENFSCELVTVILLFFVGCSGRYEGDVEHNLIKYLFTGYQRDARPVYNKSEAVHVKLDIAYSQLVNLDGKNQILSSKVWIRQIWKNPFLTWKPADYGDLRSINVDSKMVWKPDIVLYNNIGIGQTGAMYNFDTKVVIDFDGTNSWYAPTQIQSICKIDITYFPFDEQYCKLVFGSWTYTGNGINLVNARNQSDLSKYTLSGEWNLISAPVKQNFVKYACCEHPFIDVTFYIQVRRRVLFYLSNLILPSIILTVLTVFSFFLPPESGERISLVITILLGLTVFMLVFTESVPHTSEVIPLIAKYTFIVMCEVGTSLLVTCFILRIYHKGHKKDVPIWVRYFTFNIIAPLLRVKDDINVNNNSKTHRKMNKEDFTKNSSTNGVYSFIPQGGHNSTPPSIGFELAGERKGTRKSRSDDENILCSCQDSLPVASMSDGKLDELCKEVKYIANQMRDTSRLEIRKAEWHFVATVLDSAFFWLFLSSMIISTVAFYFQIPDTRRIL